MIVGGPQDEAVTVDNVFAKLEGTDYLLIPHAPKFTGMDWRKLYNPERQRLVEMCSNWGINEEGGPLSVQSALDMGHKFGFTGGTDNHYAEPGNPLEGGLTGCYAPVLTRKDIFTALRERRTFATTGQRMIISFEADGTWMGGEYFSQDNSPRIIRARAICPQEIETVEIIRNGKVVSSVAGDGKADVSFEWKDNEPLKNLLVEREMTDERFAYYYLRVKTVDNDFGWSSPVWVSGEF